MGLLSCSQSINGEKIGQLWEPSGGQCPEEDRCKRHTRAHAERNTRAFHRIPVFPQSRLQGLVVAALRNVAHTRHEARRTPFHLPACSQRAACMRGNRLRPVPQAAAHADRMLRPARPHDPSHVRRADSHLIKAPQLMDPCLP